MELRLERKVFSKQTTIGELSINGKFFCFTLEDRVRDAGVKIKGKTAIAPGKYRLALTFSNRFQRVLPLLVDVPQFEGVRIHAGNVAADTEGCILVGLSRGADWIGNSRDAMAGLMKRLQSAAKREPVSIEIV